MLQIGTTYIAKTSIEKRSFWGLYKVYIFISTCSLHLGSLVTANYTSNYWQRKGMDVFFFFIFYNQIHLGHRYTEFIFLDWKAIPPTCKELPNKKHMPQNKYKKRIKHWPKFSYWPLQSTPRREPQSTHTEWQLPISGVHSIMMDKSALAGEGGGVHAHPLSL